MKKTMSKKIVAIMVCTAALAGIYGGRCTQRVCTKAI